MNFPRNSVFIARLNCAHAQMLTRAHAYKKMAQGYGCGAVSSWSEDQAKEVGE